MSSYLKTCKVAAEADVSPPTAASWLAGRRVHRTTDKALREAAARLGFTVLVAADGSRRLVEEGGQS